MRKPMNRSLARLEPSGIRRINALAAEHPGCIALALGEPEFDTPASVREAAKAALDRGETHYPPNNGTLDARRAIASHMAEEEGLRFAPDEVILTDGATEALSSTLAAMLDPGDEVIVPTPAFGLYESIVRMHHARAIPLDTTHHGFQIDAATLRAVCSDRTKAIVICSPNNPTGCVLDARSLDAVARMAEETGAYVICDDVYHRLVYEEGVERFAARHPELRAQTVIVDSFSKPWAMTGWRLGWVAADAEVLAQIAKAHQYLVSSAVSFVMPAVQTALGIDPAPAIEVYRARRDRVLAQLAFMGLPVVEPKGAFYAFPSIAPTGLESGEFCERAIREVGVALVPGTCFGAEGHVRLSYCVSDEDLDEGMRRLAAFVAGL
ncbi:MAG: aminotransferase class I/II-fold pyridoxal phosphate-dependent enzyme [Collinsella sp.]|nr:aminotransferase class I/II-fold pyridoxal phosphate-dependent enzyme [Collinsella sp.]